MEIDIMPWNIWKFILGFKILKAGVFRILQRKKFPSIF